MRLQEALAEWPTTAEAAAMALEGLGLKDEAVLFTTQGPNDLRRVLVACDAALAEFTVEPGSGRVSAVVHAWSTVSPPELQVAWLMSTLPVVTTVQLHRPEFTSSAPGTDEALVAFWAICRDRAGARL